MLAQLMILSGCLSTLGCFSIMHRIGNSPRKTNSYDRIMFGLGASDMVASITYILTPFLLPTNGPSPRVYASGSAVSCSILGWLTQLSYATASYTCALSFYFLAIIKYRINIDDFAIRFEAYIHGLTVFFFLFTATSGVPLQMYDEMEMGMYCWIKNDFPKRCSGDYCFGDTIGWVYGGAIVIFAFIVLLINHLQIWFQIKRKLPQFRSSTNIQGSDTPNFAIRIRRSATQIGLYMVVFYLTNATTIVLRIMEQSYGYTVSREREIFKLLVAHSFLVPLNGFWTAFIHARPNYVKLRLSKFRFGTSIWLAFWNKDVDVYLDGPGAETIARYSFDNRSTKGSSFRT